MALRTGHCCFCACSVLIQLVLVAETGQTPSVEGIEGTTSHRNINTGLIGDVLALFAGEDRFGEALLSSEGVVVWITAGETSSREGVIVAAGTAHIHASPEVEVLPVRTDGACHTSILGYCVAGKAFCTLSSVFVVGHTRESRLRQGRKLLDASLEVFIIVSMRSVIGALVAICWEGKPNKIFGSHCGESH
jgi:hypothetical protein